MDICNSLNIVCLIVYFIIDSIVEYVLFPNAEDIRKSDFISNSWGIITTSKPSEQYYSNDEINFGLYKMTLNLFENSFFSYNVSKSMLLKKIIITSFFAVLIIVISYYGFKSVPIAIPLLQVIFSTMILGDLIKLLIFINRVKRVFDNWELLFIHNDFAKDTSKYQSEIYKNWLYYESTLARTQITLSNAKFNELNQRLSHEWNQIKAKFSIA